MQYTTESFLRDCSFHRVHFYAAPLVGQPANEFKQRLCKTVHLTQTSPAHSSYKRFDSRQYKLAAKHSVSTADTHNKRTGRTLIEITILNQTNQIWNNNKPFHGQSPSQL